VKVDVLKFWHCSEDSGDGEPDLSSGVPGLEFRFFFFFFLKGFFLGLFSGLFFRVFLFKVWSKTKEYLQIGFFFSG
jgi:hypothetical protein